MAYPRSLCVTFCAVVGMHGAGLWAIWSARSPAHALRPPAQEIAFAKVYFQPGLQKIVTAPTQATEIFASEKTTDLKGMDHKRTSADKGAANILRDEARTVVPIDEPEAESSSAAIETDFDGYYPRSLLSVVPLAISPVMIPFPEVEGFVDLKVQVALFIDELGIVRQVRVDTPNLSEVFSSAVVNSFFGSQFTPGQIQGEFVKSRIAIEVEFLARNG